LETTNPQKPGSDSVNLTRVIESVKFGYQSTALSLEMLKIFRDMVNHAIRICLEEDISGRFNLRNRIYKDFRRTYGVASNYPPRR
jgi:hypothetical protein